MRFQDPLEIKCDACGATIAVPVRSLLRLEAFCPDCQASLREIGLAMRANCDETATFFKAVEVIMQIEDEHGVQIPDSVVQDTGLWEQLTIRDLVNAAHSCLDDRDNELCAETVVFTAIKTLFPNVQETLPLDAPLLDAIAPDRDYGASYD